MNTLVEMSVARMRSDGASEHAINAFAHRHRLIASGHRALIGEDEIDPVTSLPVLDELHAPTRAGAEALARTAVIKLNGGLATSMGLQRAKSLLPVADGASFLDVAVAQVLAARAEHSVRLPLLLMNSFHTRRDSLAALERHETLPVDGLPLDFTQGRVPRLLASNLSPLNWPADPELEWCPGGHADVYTELAASGLLDDLITHGYRYAFIANADNLGARPEPRIAGWMHVNGIPFVMEAVHRTPDDRKGGHLAIRRRDGRLILRETAQTPPENVTTHYDGTRHRFTNTNNIWVDLHALRSLLAEADGILDLPVIRNEKTADPRDPTTPQVIQLEVAMGAAIQVFPDAQAVLVGRDRFIPVKTTNDLLLVRSDAYRVGDGGRVVAQFHGETPPFIDLDRAVYANLDDFERRFADGMPSVAGCDRLVVRGDVTFGRDVVVIGAVTIDAAIDGADVQAFSLLGFGLRAPGPAARPGAYDQRRHVTS